MNPHFTRIQSLGAALLTSLASVATLSAAPAGGNAFEVEVWMVELPPASAITAPETIPGAGRLQLSSLDAATWLQSVGGASATSTHLVLNLADSEDFSIELPRLGCSFHGTGTLEDGAVRLDLVSVDSPERPMPDCNLEEAEAPAPTPPAGRASARETSITVSADHTLVFSPADRGDGRQRLILWRTVTK